MKRLPKVGKPKNPNRERFEIALDAVTDKDVVEQLNKQINKSEYVRKLVRDDIRRTELYSRLFKEE